MKTIKSFIALFFLLLVEISNAQTNPSDSIKTSTLSVITKHDGTEYIGTIISDDGRELLITTKALGKIYIPKSEVKSIVKEVDTKSIVYGEYQSEGAFTTRYAFTNNALPIKKGENYAMVNLYGPEVHFAVSDHLNVGIMSTWLASPLVLALKYSFKTEESKVNYSLGTMIGTSGFLNNWSGYYGMHWGSLTLGDRKNNLTCSAGYTYLQSGGTEYNPQLNTNEASKLTHGPILSLAGILKVGAKASFIFDSMISYLNHESTTAIYDQLRNQTTFNTTQHATALFIMPGMRFQNTDKKAFQISLAGVTFFSKYDRTSFPFPMCTWFFKF
jgi:hypothetical protein